MKDYEFFKAKELACKCGKCDGGQMDKITMERLVALRRFLAFPFTITSGFRCIDYNRSVGGARQSAHTKGRAVDIAAQGQKAWLIVTECAKFGFTGIGVSQKETSRFIHIDDDHITPRIWSY